jgi:hypothetical protein
MAATVNIRAVNWTALMLVLIAVASCGENEKTTKQQDSGDWQNKIAFDLSQIRADGLTGPPDAMVSVAYEFCIPRDRVLLARVLAIDSTVKYTAEAPGRIGCGKTEYLCMGDTHTPRWRDILRQIASLDYVTRIERTDWE